MSIGGYDISEGRVYDGEKTGCAFSAGHVRYEVLTRLLRIGGGITGRLPDGAVFTAGGGTVDLRREILAIPGPVKMEGKDVKMSADGLTADLAAEMVTLRGNVAIAWRGGVIRADEVLYSAKDGTFSVRGTPGKGVDLEL
jgi:hypothetical protein